MDVAIISPSFALFRAKFRLNGAKKNAYSSLQGKIASFYFYYIGFSIKIN
nr:MAG TPA: hypothetical protein [Caudoviricetes sp.]